MMESNTERCGINHTTTPRTFNPAACASTPLTDYDTDWSIGATMKAVIKHTALTPDDLTLLLSKMPKNSHIISIKVNQFEHADCKPGEMYNSVDIEFHTDDSIKPPVNNGIVYRDPGMSRSLRFDGSDPRITLCEHHIGDPQTIPGDVVHAGNTTDIVLTPPMIRKALLPTYQPQISLLDEDLIHAAKTDKPNELWHYVSISKDCVEFTPVKDITDVIYMSTVDRVFVDMTTLSLVTSDDVTVDLKSDPNHNRILAYSHDMSNNTVVEYIIRKFNQLRAFAAANNIKFKLYPNSDDLELYYHEDYPDCILADTKTVRATLLEMDKENRNGRVYAEGSIEPNTLNPAGPTTTGTEDIG